MAHGRLVTAVRTLIGCLLALHGILACAATASERPRLHTPDDLAHRRIAVLLGSAHVDYVERTWPRATLLQYGAPADLILAVKTGKADAALSDAEPLREMMRQDRSIGTLGGDLFSFPLGVGFRKGNPMAADFDAFLGTLKADGTHADMVRRWMESNITDMPAMANQRSGPELVVGISDGTLPYAALQGSRWIGFEIEMMERFAARLDRPLRLVQLEFASLIAAVATGKVDLIVSAIFITEERQRNIDFSQPYYAEATRAFGLKRNIAAYAGEDDGIDATPGLVERLAWSFRTNLLEEQRYLLLWSGLKATVIITVLSTLLGTVLGALLCMTRMSARAIPRVTAQYLIEVVRGVPVLVLLMLVFYVVFAAVDIDPTLAAVLAFGINFAAYAAEIFRSGIRSVDRGQTEAGIAMGFSRWRTFRHVVLPQATRNALPVFRSEFVSLLKMTSIVGYIAVQDLARAGDLIRSRTFDAFFPLLTVAVLYFLLALLLVRALEALERKLAGPRRRHRTPEPA